MKAQILSRKDKVFARVSVDELLVYLASNYDPDKVMEIAESCGFDLDSALATWSFSRHFHEHGKDHFEERLIHWRGIYYKHNELRYKCPSKMEYKGFLKKLILSGYSYQFTAIKSIEILEKFAGGRLLISGSENVVSSSDASFLDYIKSGECYKEELTVYFENIPELFFSFSFYDEEGERKAFVCCIHCSSRNADFEKNTYVYTRGGIRKYYNVPEYFNNRFMQFMSRGLLIGFFSSESTLTNCLCEYLQSRNVLLPNLHYTSNMSPYEMKTEIEKMMEESSMDIESLNSLVRRVTKMETKRGVLPQHLTFLILYLRDFVLRRKALLSKWSKEKNLKALQEEYEKTLKPQ